jgi:DNA invertase Pin-like site-specific DNA recombinase
VNFAKQQGIEESSIIWKEEEVSAYQDDYDMNEDWDSVSATTRRSEFQAMIQVLKNDSYQRIKRKQRYEGILCFDASRLARNPEDFLLIEKLIQRGYRILSVSENIVDSAPGFFFFRSLQIEAIYYSDRQSSKSSRYKLHALLQEPRKSLG